VSAPAQNLFARIVSILGAGLVVWFVGAALFGADGVARHERLESELQHVAQLNAQLVADNRRLAQEAKALRTDKRYVERVIRDELGWIRADEVVLLFPSGEGDGR
jgi:cell division protein FtsB